MGIDFGCLGSSVAKQLASHAECFAGHDGLAGIGVAKVVQADIAGQPDLVADGSPRRIQYRTGPSGVVAGREHIDRPPADAPPRKDG